MPVPRRSTEPGLHAPNALVDFHTGLDEPFVHQTVEDLDPSVPGDAVRLLINRYRVVDHELEELRRIGKVQNSSPPRVAVLVVFFVARVRRVDNKIGLSFHIRAVPRLEDVVRSRSEARRLVVVQRLAAELVRDLRALRRGLCGDQRLARRRRCLQRCCGAGPEEQLQLSVVRHRFGNDQYRCCDVRTTSPASAAALRRATNTPAGRLLVSHTASCLRKQPSAEPSTPALAGGAIRAAH